MKGAILTVLGFVAVATGLEWAILSAGRSVPAGLLVGLGFMMAYWGGRAS